MKVLTDSQDGYNYRVMGTWMLILAFFILQLLVYTWCRVQCIHVGYEISRQADNYQQLVAIQNTLRIELERLKSPDRIASIARYQLGLVTPDPQHQITLFNYDTR